MTVDVAIIGAGISGLASAFDLHSRGYSVAVLERQQQIGGKAISEHENGFLFEHGPSTLNPELPDATTLIDTLGLNRERCELGENVKKRYLVSDGKLSGIDTHALGFFTSNYLPLTARLRMLMEIAVPRGSNSQNETIAEFVARRFGKSFAEQVMDPMAAGIYAGQADQLSLAAVFPKLLNMEQQYGSITRALLSKNAGNMPARKLYSWRGGIGSLATALAGRLEGRIHTGAAVKWIRKTAGGFQIETGSGGFRCKAVVIATQPQAAAAMLEKLDPDSADAAASIMAPPLAVIYLGYRRSQVSHALDGLGFLTTRQGAPLLNGAQFSSTMFEGRAPDGYVSISSYVGGARNPEFARRPPGELTEAVHENLAALLGIRGRPVFSRSRQWMQGLPQYTLGHCQKVEKIETASARHPGLYLTGNYLKGPSVAMCVSQGLDTADKVSGFLAGQSDQPLSAAY